MRHEHEDTDPPVAQAQRRPRPGVPSRVDADVPRHEIVERLRAVAALIERHLPKQVPAGRFLLPWETVAPTLLARIAGQGRSIATLLEAKWRAHRTVDP